MNYVKTIVIEALDSDIMVIVRRISHSTLRAINDHGYQVESIEHLPQGVKIWLRRAR